MLEIWKTLTGIGGLLRVRSVLAIGFTVGGIGYMLGYHEMPPPQYNLLWASAIAYYFGTRGGSQ